jgi:O-Antigen ligase
MRAAALVLLRAGLLAGPTALAFASGGYFPRATAWAGIVAWALAVTAAICCGALPRSGPGRAALAGLALLAGWTALSQGWAPLAGPAARDVERDLLYLAAFLAACAAFRAGGGRVVEPALAAGTLVVVGYGLAGRLLPGLVRLDSSARAGGRLEQPLTYWNAMGALAAIGVVLCVRLAGDATRPARLRAAAAAATPALATGVYLSFSRGALAALAAGLLALVVLAPSWPQVRALVIAAEAGVLAAALASTFAGVQSLAGSLARREAQGAAMTGILLALAMLAGATQAWACRDERAGRVRAGSLGVPRRAPAVAALVVAGLLAAPLVLAAARSAPRAPAFGATAQRLGSTGSNRYAYWRVALRTFADHPVRGVGTSGFRVAWLERRRVPDAARDAHSLYLETAAELGLVGLAFLGLFFAGVAAAARRALARAPALAAGPCAALLMWALHAGLDWAWEMPALTLVAIVLAGLAVGAGEDAAPAQRRAHLGDETPLEP